MEISTAALACGYDELSRVTAALTPSHCDCGMGKTNPFFPKKLFEHNNRHEASMGAQHSVTRGNTAGPPRDRRTYIPSICER